VLTRAPTAAYDVVFCDPPYVQPVAEVLDVLAGPHWLAPDAVVVIERATRDPQLSWPDGIEAVQSRRYGDSTLWYGRRS
jgi:16S rRNA (guanine966-N2)-methyltransferase